MLNACPTASAMLEACEHAADHVGDVRPRANLRAVVVDLEVASRERCLDERANRAAPDLARPVDVERMHRDRGQAELVVVGVRHVLAGELRHGVRPARFADRADRRHLPFVHVRCVGAEYLARREVDEALERVQCPDRRFERVERADHVHAHHAHGALQHRVDAGDRSAMDEVRGADCCLTQGLRVEDVAAHEREVRMRAELGLRQRVAMEVVERDDGVLVDELLRERRADEPGAARDEDPFALQHPRKVSRRPVTRRSRRPGSRRRAPLRPRRAARRASSRSRAGSRRPCCRAT